MKCAILAAGRGSRLGSITKTLPKFFLDFDGISVHKNQLKLIENYCDEVVLVLGHGFVEEKTINGNLDQFNQVHQEKIRDDIYCYSHPDIDFTINIDKVNNYINKSFNININVLVIPYWNLVENAESCRQGLDFFDDEDIILLSGDRFLTNNVISKAISRFSDRIIEEPYHVVSALNRVEKNKTAVNWDRSGKITEYGLVEGHPDTGVFIINKHLLSESKNILQNNPKKWWPIIFTRLDSYSSTVDPSQHHEINKPNDVQDIINKIPD
jgi:NDP-sugar pyrophosphorylase family protein